MDIQHIYIPSVYTNCYLLSQDGQAAVIDPGDGDAGTLSTLRRLLTEGGLELRYILLTHGHFDHVGGVAALRRAYPGSEVYLHPGDADMDDPRGFPGVPGALPLADGQVLKLGSLDITVLSTPGHSRGSVCFLCGDTLFSGDTLFAGTCGRCDFPGGSYDQMLSSLARLSRLEGDYRVLPGHEVSTTLDAERRHNPYIRAALEGGK